MLTITIEQTDRSALEAIQAVLQRASHLRPVLAEIGEDMAASTKARFRTATAPDGTPWAPNSAVTLERYSERFGSGLRKKDGLLNTKGQAKLEAKLPLTGETKALQTTINYQFVGDNAVAIGSPSRTSVLLHHDDQPTTRPESYFAEWPTQVARQVQPRSDAEIEAHIQASGANTGRRITQDQIATLVSTLDLRVHHFPGTTSMVVIASLPDGFVVGIGHSACVSAENFRAEVGAEIAKDKAIAAAREKLWELEGYRLRCAMIED